MYCVKCGTQLAEDSAYCSKCGEKQQHLEETKTSQEVITPDVSGTRSTSASVIGIISMIIALIMIIMAFSGLAKSCS